MFCIMRVLHSYRHPNRQKWRYKNEREREREREREPCMWMYMKTHLTCGNGMDIPGALIKLYTEPTPPLPSLSNHHELKSARMCIFLSVVLRNLLMGVEYFVCIGRRRGLVASIVLMAGSLSCRLLIWWVASLYVEDCVLAAPVYYLYV